MSYFKLKERKTNLKTEIAAGITTFMTMSYIIFVNPAILSQGGQTGVSFESVVMATCLGAGLMSVAMGVITNTPFALASGMGVNTIVVFTLIYGLGLNFSQAMGIIVIEGIMAAVLALTRLRKMLMKAIPLDLKYALCGGIGFFLAFTGVQQAGFVDKDPVTVLRLGDLTSGYALVAAFGLVLTASLAAFKIKGSILLGILGTAAAGLAFKVVPLPERIFAVPTAESFQTFFQADLPGSLWAGGMVNIASLVMVFALFMTDFFNTLGTVIGVGSHAGLMEEDGKIPGLRKVLLIDGLATAIGGFLGAGSVSVYRESASGVSDGGRSGVMPAVTGFLFLLAVFFAPLIAVVGGGIEVGGMYRYPVTAPALIIVGFLMMRMITRINFKDFDIGLPAFLTVAIMPFTYNISYGMGFGFISYTVIKLIRGKHRELHPLMIVVSALFAAGFIAESIIKRAG
ncbi:MAG: NCS2 family permease [Actinomycetota bacterium]